MWNQNLAHLSKFDHLKIWEVFLLYSIYSLATVATPPSLLLVCFTQCYNNKQLTWNVTTNYIFRTSCINSTGSPFFPLSLLLHILISILGLNTPRSCNKRLSGAFLAMILCIYRLANLNITGHTPNN